MTRRIKGMSGRLAAVTALTGALIATSFSTPSAAGAAGTRLTIIHISRTMALPGVTLPPGSYTFELLNPGSGADAVVVSSGAAHRKVHFLGLTRRIDRPRTMQRDQVISIGEAPAGEPVPITAWYPAGSASGHQFLYR